MLMRVSETGTNIALKAEKGAIIMSLKIALTGGVFFSPKTNVI